MMLDVLAFSIDGIDDATVTKYQVGGKFETMYKNLADLVSYRDRLNRKKPWLEWKYVLFNWNDRPQMIHTAIELARKIGVDSISFWPTPSPLRGISWRYYLGRFFNRIGEPSWKGREVFFNRPSHGPQEPEQQPLAKGLEMQGA